MDKQKLGSGALRPVREMSDFIPQLSAVSSTSPHLAMTYALIRGASPPAQRLITAAQTQPRNCLTSGEAGKNTN